MIDFRYHLVSIVSIFLALAVGIVLGAGPLKEDIGNTLTSEVNRLREDRTQLRAQLEEADKAAQARDDFTEASNKSLLAGRLQDSTLTVVVLPGADENLVKATTSSLALAGAKIGSTVTVLDSWVDPDKQTFRSTLGDQLAPSVQVPVDEGGNILDDVLARALLTKAGGNGAGSAAALEGLRTGDLIRYTPDDIEAATGAVVIGGPVSGGTAAERTERAEALSSLAGALDAAGSGAVLVAQDAAASDSPQTSVVAVARQDADQAKELSTVDNGAIPMGQASVVFGLLEQFAGNVGQYGLGADATAAFPTLATK
ncbi:copper transporter [Knoellia sp. p5-6-4]|uniref:copper transporter n=1 Tax=unclassified Knoellia TaxID=2618719 RepID=UPI0023DA6FB9|nr:copper transporter [Knoellia sp. p5-6-4]MDF2145877.1 copper transporter [Knoellia sp. p5-6-4]